MVNTPAASMFLDQTKSCVEKALFKDGLSIEDVMKFARHNAKDIIAMGFNPKSTFIVRPSSASSGWLHVDAV